jgi:hypothetical protein
MASRHRAPVAAHRPAILRIRRGSRAPTGAAPAVFLLASTRRHSVVLDSWSPHGLASPVTTWWRRENMGSIPSRDREPVASKRGHPASPMLPATPDSSHRRPDTHGDKSDWPGRRRRSRSVFKTISHTNPRRNCGGSRRAPLFVEGRCDVLPSMLTPSPRSFLYLLLVGAEVGRHAGRSKRRVYRPFRAVGVWLPVA